MLRALAWGAQSGIDVPFLTGALACAAAAVRTVLRLTRRGRVAGGS